MKTWFALALGVFLSLSCMACFPIDGDQQDQPQKEQPTTTTTNVVTEEIFGLNETAAFRDLKFTATEIKESDGSGFFVPDKGNIFVGVKFVIENCSDEDQSVSTMLLFDGYADDVKCGYSLSASGAFSEGTLDGTIAPGKKLVGWYGLEVPQDWKSLELQVQSNWLFGNVAKFVFEK